MPLFRRQGADGTRVFTVSSVEGPTKAQRCQAGPRPALPSEFTLQKFPAGSQRASRGRSQYSKAAIATRTANRPHKRNAGHILRISIIQSEKTATTPNIHTPH